MKKNVVFRILILSSLLVCILSSLSVAFVNAASEVELYYDDGEAEDGWSWNAAGNLFAVRFTPTTSGQLVECSFYIMLDPATIKVHVLDKNKQDMITSFSATPTSTGWFHVDLSTYEITVSPDADFYVAMEAIATNAPYLGTDWNDPDGRSWMEYEGDWYRYDDFLQEEGDLMIRAVIEPSV